MPEPIYEVTLVGECQSHMAGFISRLSDAVRPFGLQIGRDIVVATGRYQPREANLVLYFAGSTEPDAHLVDFIDNVVELGVPIIPVWDAADEDATPKLPISLHQLHYTSFDSSGDFRELIDVVLSGLQIVGTSRRAFISYPRTNGSATAGRLADELGARGFDVFLDTRSIRAGENFQDTLTHRLTDSDVFILLATGKHSASRWIELEVQCALGLHIGILPIAWPGVTLSDFDTVAEPVQLSHADFDGDDASHETILEICSRIEQVRAKCIALKYAHLQSLSAEFVKSRGGDCAPRAPGRIFSLNLATDQPEPKWGYVQTGVPKSELLHRLSAEVGDDKVALFYNVINSASNWHVYWTWLAEKLGFVTCLPLHHTRAFDREWED